MANSAAPVVWRRGVHLAGTNIWCDARRAQDVCFVSSADAVSPARHGQLIATAETLALLRRGDRRTQPETALSTPYGRPFTLGAIRLELIRSGHAAGSASLLAHVKDHRILYAGAVNLSPGRAAGAADVRSCDTLIIDATYGGPEFCFPVLDESVARVGRAAIECRDNGQIFVLLVTSAAKGLAVADRLQNYLQTCPNGPISAEFIAHRSIHHAMRRLGSLYDGPPLKRWAGTDPYRKNPRGSDLPEAENLARILLWPAARAPQLETVEFARRPFTALLSGLSCDKNLSMSSAIDTAICWSDRADGDQLLRYIESSGASRVYLLNAVGDEFAKRCRGAGLQTEILGPPRQLALF